MSEYQACQECGDNLLCHYCLRKPLLEELSTLRAKLKLAEDVVEAAERWMKKHEVLAAECFYQRDSVNLALPELAEEIYKKLEALRAHDEGGTS